MLQVFCNISSFWPNGMDYGAHPDTLVVIAATLEYINKLLTFILIELP